MKYIITIIAITLGIIASIAFLLLFRAQVSAGAIVGYGSVLGLLGVASLEYSTPLKRPCNR